MVPANTKLQHRSAMRNLLDVIGSQPVDRITAADVAELVTKLSETRKRETVRKSLLVLGMVLDFAGITPNVARDKTIKLPREDRLEIKPPSAEHVEAVLHVLPERYRLPLLVLDAARRARGAYLGRRGRVTAALACLRCCCEDAKRSLGAGSARSVRGRERARCA